MGKCAAVKGLFGTQGFRVWGSGFRGSLHKCVAQLPPPPAALAAGGGRGERTGEQVAPAAKCYTSERGGRSNHL
jgi:hypothetical protein